jgi:erythromycin esterase-like protein
VRQASEDASAEEALSGFRRFPTWMWRNREVVELLEWLRAWNARSDREVAVGVYGLDLYSLSGSMQEVLRYLDGVDPGAAARVRARYGCFDSDAEDPQDYARRIAWREAASCEQEVVAALAELCEQAARSVRVEGVGAEEAAFAAEQNARVVRGAEQYYREMVRGRVNTWNLRDTHMVDTLDALDGHLSRRLGRPARIVVWEHNSHLGDARATDMGRWGEVNVGQLVRERHPGESWTLGFTTHTGTVTAADDWDGPHRTMRVNESRPGSWEHLFHETGLGRFLLPLGDAAPEGVRGERKRERAIGVIYRPASERTSHEFGAEIAAQFDAVVHLDQTNALEPLDRDEPPAGAEAETWPQEL